MVICELNSLQDLQRNFEVSLSKVSIMGSAIQALHSFVLPFVGILMDKIGPKNVCLTGVALTSTSLLISFLIDHNFWAFFVFYGVLNGAGLGLLFLPASTVCTLYFKDRQSTVHWHGDMTKDMDRHI